VRTLRSSQSNAPKFVAADNVEQGDKMRIFCLLFSLFALPSVQVAPLTYCDDGYEFAFYWNPVTPSNGNLVGRTLGKHQVHT